MLLALSICTLLCTLTTAAADSPTFPTVVLRYSCTTVATIHNSPSNVYTLAFREAYDDTTKTYATQGRFGSAHTTELIYFSEQRVVTFDVRSPESTCATFSLSAYPNLEQVRPTQMLFDSFAAHNKVFLGQTREVRNLLADKWSINGTALSASGVLMNYSYLVYIQHDLTPEPARVPLRVVLTGTAADPAVARRVAHTYDWIAFSVGEPPAAMLFAPSSCQPGAAPAMLPLPTDAAIGAPNPIMPPFPQQFTSLVEAKLAETSQTGEFTTQYLTMQWTLDVPKWSERIDLYIHDLDQEPDSPLSTRSLIYTYTPGTVWGTSGPIYAAVRSQASAAYSACSIFPVVDLTQSIMKRLRAGGVPGVFVNAANAATRQSYSFIGRRITRGLEADVYRAPFHLKHGLISFNFDMDVYFSAQGVAHVGRNDAFVSTQTLLRIVNTGNFTDLSIGKFATYMDEWDFYMLQPGAASTEFEMRPQSIGCVGSSDQNSSFGVNLGFGTIAASVALGALVGCLVVLGAGTFLWRKYRAEHGGHDSVPLDDADRDAPEARSAGEVELQEIVSAQVSKKRRGSRGKSISKGARPSDSRVDGDGA